MDAPLMLKENIKMKFIKTASIAAFSLFLFTVAAYWFNLDTKLVKMLEKPMMNHYNTMPRDHRL